MTLIGNGPLAGSELLKVDSLTTDGLLGVENSLAYRIAEIERHLHNIEKWFGVAATPSGETHVADRMAGGIQPFTFTTGNDDFGPWVQVLGSGDTPVYTGAAKFDLHRFLVVNTNSTNTYILQAVAGESADIAAKIAAEEFSEAPYIASSNLNDSGINDVMVRRQDAGVKVWVRAACIGTNAVTISLYFGIHEYEG